MFKILGDTNLKNVPDHTLTVTDKLFFGFTSDTLGFVLVCPHENVFIVYQLTTLEITTRVKLEDLDITLDDLNFSIGLA